MTKFNNYLILIKGEDKTDSIVSWRFDSYKPVVFISFGSEKEYPYNTSSVQIFKNPEVIDMDDKIVYKDRIYLYGVLQLQVFESYCRIIYKSGYKEVVEMSRIYIVRSAFSSPKVKKCFEYFKQIGVLEYKSKTATEDAIAVIMLVFSIPFCFNKMEMPTIVAISKE